MNRTKSILQCASLIVCLTIFVSAESANAQTNVQQSSVSTSCQNDPQCMTGNPDGTGASRLNAHDRILVQAPAVAVPSAMCLSVLNNGGNDVFVPWRTPQEWTSFLAAVCSNGLTNSQLCASLTNGASKPSASISAALDEVQLSQCCQPLNANVCGEPVYYPGTGTPTPLGYRSLGTLAGDKTPTANWGAETDILGPLSAPAPLNYQVTYVCTNGSWVKTREVGSCTPTNGYCSSLDGQYIQNFPTDPSTYTQSLCATGSTFDTTIGLQTTATGWSWTCDGTQGMTNASCSAYKNPPINGQCGAINNMGGSGQTYTVDQLVALQALSPDQICQSGTWNGVFQTNGNINKYVTWDCTGQNGGTNSPTCGVPSAQVNGACGSDNGQTYTTQENNPPASGLCLKVGEVAQNLTSTPTGWSWICSGIGSGSNSGLCSATYNPTLSNGNCGSSNGSYFPDGTLTADNGNLCSSGTVANFTNTLNQWFYWSWNCVGASGGSTSWCAAYDKPQVNGTCGALNGSVDDAVSSADPALCSSGIVSNFTGTKGNAPFFWNWTCNGSSGGSSQTCNAFKDPNIANAVCGVAAGTSSLGAPTVNLCSYGNPSPVNQSPDGTKWQWSCQSLDGSTTTSCASSVIPPVADGVCGGANGTAIPNTPNYNLCGVGTASTIAGTGPWSWTCLGTGGGASSSTCTAYQCNACTGTTTRIQSATRSGTIGSCNITGTATWTEIDGLIAGAASPANISWTDSLGSFFDTIPASAAPWPTYCPPCYLQAQSAQNVATTITSVSGSCSGYSVGQVIRQ